MLRHQLRPHSLVTTGLFACLLPACPMRAPEPQTASVPPYSVRDRMDRVAVGQPQADVQALLGRRPVRKPNHPEAPFPTPIWVLELSAPDGRSVRLESYVVATRATPGCPDFQYDDVPLAFIDGVVAGKGWEYLEQNWRRWGGSLDALREAQAHAPCLEEAQDR